ncbi:MAG: hypothetical protein ACRC5T_06430 [Cetobacterium sp.]
MNIKEMMLNEIKKQNFEKVEEVVQELESSTEEGFIPVSNKSKRKRKRKKKTTSEKFEGEFLEKNEEVIETDEEFEIYKSKMMEDERFQDLSDYIIAEKMSGSEIFTMEEYLRFRKEHDIIKIVAIEPTDSEKERGSISKFYIVKPLYPEEYTKFTREVGPRNLYPDKFRKFTLEKGVLHFGSAEKDLTKLSSGATFTLYHTIIDISDLNKSVKVFEV